MAIGLEEVKAATSKAYAAGAYQRLNGKERVAVFISPEPLKGGTTVQIGPHKRKLAADAYLVFVDLRYNANFAHPVIYEMHNVADGKITTIEEEWPLDDMAFERSLIAHIMPKKEGK